ncbi:hypothetical protein HK405_014409 [Cladochytrium tenue]|nr:hypothetical protein HK405_014409 [Cladochytrium tenue]
MARPGDFTRDVGRKFTEDGAVRRYPGNTVVFDLPADSPLRAPLLALHRELADANASGHSLAGTLGLLPPASWHMTLFSGVCDQSRGNGRGSSGGGGRSGDGVRWPADLPLDSPLEHCTTHFVRKLQTHGLTSMSPSLLGGGGPASPVRMTVPGRTTYGVGLHLLPASASEAQRLGGLRDRLADALQLRSKDHANYEFHLSLSYIIRVLDRGQAEELDAIMTRHLPAVQRMVVEFGAPDFCSFEDMAEFKPVLALHLPRLGGDNSGQEL